ncbi:hypothetical protein DSO57_1020529 [Entomophthora muscae]|uniref:Uncharacterized protein n=1 Tax=Entomophthora muscae TaxID=34485 RepID=A0ACC2S5R0_9FUNG|nr:hypothetical protein DSO57_1020529 [Entomophthora muscae]
MIPFDHLFHQLASADLYPGLEVDFLTQPLVIKTGLDFIFLVYNSLPQAFRPYRNPPLDGFLTQSRMAGYRCRPIYGTGAAVGFRSGPHQVLAGIAICRPYQTSIDSIDGAVYDRPAVFGTDCSRKCRGRIKIRPA